MGSLFQEIKEVMSSVFSRACSFVWNVISFGLVIGWLVLMIWCAYNGDGGCQFLLFLLALFVLVPVGAYLTGSDKW